MNKLIFVFITFSVLSISACRDKIALNDMRVDTFARYIQRYDAAQNKTSAYAEFFKHDEAGIKLNVGRSVPAKVVFNYTDARFDDSRLFYSTTFNNKVNSIVVRYSYVDGDIPFINNLSLPAVISLPEEIAVISKNSDLSFTFGGQGIGADEKVVLKIGDVTFENSVLGSTGFNIKSNELSAIKSGSTKVTLTRIKRLPADEGTMAGGVKQSEYSTGAKSIVVL